MLLLARLGLGVAEGPVFPASGKLNAVWLPARERGRGAVLIDGGAPIGDRIWRADHRVADRRVLFLANGACGRRIGRSWSGLAFRLGQESNSPWGIVPVIQRWP